jgi:RNA polymerase sigma-70 factor (ECF subfamily)
LRSFSLDAPAGRSEPELTPRPLRGKKDAPEDAMTMDAASGRQRMLLSLTRVAGDPVAAEDCLQAAHVRLAEFRRSRTVLNEKGFLVHTARNIAIDEARRARTRAEAPGGIDAVVELRDEQPLQDEVLLARERLARVREALGLLPERTRDIFLMHRLGGLKYREIADRVGVSVSAVEKHIAKATLRLAECLAE